jgi:spermidine/putrescine transport system permease protein
MKSDSLFKQISITTLCLWLAIFALIPNLLVIGVSFLERGDINLVELHFTFNNYLRLVNTLYLKIFWHSFYLAAISTFICFLIGYPFAYILAQLESRFKPALLCLVIIPFWTSSLIRSYAMVAILKAKGLLNTFLLSIGIIHEPFHLLYSNTAVLIGLVYNLLPFMILPLYTNIEKLDTNLIDAARDLGANKITAFFKITLPLTKSGIIAGTMLVLLPAMSMFYIPDLLGGAKSLLIGNLIKNQFLSARDWPMGCAVSITLTLLMGIMLLIYFRQKSDIAKQELL